MSDSKESSNQPKPEASIDIFNTKPRVEPEKSAKTDGVATNVEKPATNTKPKGKFAAPLLVGVATMVLAAGWILWPSQKKNVDMGSSHVLNVEQSMPASNPASQQIVSTPKEATAEPLSNPPDQPTNTEPAAAVLPPAQPASKELDTKLAEVENRLTAVEQQADKLTQQIAAISTPSKVESVHHRSVHKPVAVEAKHADVASPQKPTEEIVNTGFTLNTIYQDQAWIQNATHTHTFVVQAGDVIDGLRIERIEPVAHQVVTSAGIIK